MFRAETQTYYYLDGQTDGQKKKQPHFYEPLKKASGLQSASLGYDGKVQHDGDGNLYLEA